MISEVDVLFSGTWAGDDYMLKVTVDLFSARTVGAYAVDTFSGFCYSRVYPLPSRRGTILCFQWAI